MDLLDDSVLDTLEQDVLQPAVVARGIAKAMHEMRLYEGNAEAHREGLRKQLAHVDGELIRLAQAIASGGSLSSLVSAIHEREQRRARLRTEIAAIDGMTHAQFDAGVAEEELRSYLADWTSLAKRHYAQTRQLLRKLLPSRIRVWRELQGGEKCYRYEGEAAVGRFFSGLVEVKRLGVPNGI